MEIRRSYDRLISTMEFPILVRRLLYIESGPSNVERVSMSPSPCYTCLVCIISALQLWVFISRCVILQLLSPELTQLPRIRICWPGSPECLQLLGPCPCYVSELRKFTFTPESIYLIQYSSYVCKSFHLWNHKYECLIKRIASHRILNLKQLQSFVV